MSRYFGIFFPFWYVVARKIWQPCSPVQDEPITFRKQVSYPYIFTNMHLKVNKVGKSRFDEIA
jgi:hypothetical protein